MGSPSRRAIALALISCVGAVGASAVADAAPKEPTESGSSATKTRICVIKKTKRARVVRTTERCVRGEERMSWKRYQDYVTNNANSSNSSASSDAAGPAGPAGPQGLTGDTGATGARGPSGGNGANGATGATGERGERGEQGERGLAGATGGTGPSDIYTTTGGARSATTSSEDTRATLNLPAGQYLLMGQANAFSSSDIGQFFVRCRIRVNTAPLVEDSASFADSTPSSGGGSNPEPDQANLLLVAPLTTSGATVRLHCEGILGMPLIGNVQLTAIKTGALHT